MIFTIEIEQEVVELSNFKTVEDFQARLETIKEEAINQAKYNEVNNLAKDLVKYKDLPEVVAVKEAIEIENAKEVPLEELEVDEIVK